MASMEDARRLVDLDNGLASLATLRPQGGAHVTVVNAGVLPHPMSSELVAAFVARPGTRKLEHLRADPRATVSWRAGWAWCTIEGEAQLIGPDDPAAQIDLPALLRSIYSSAGGQHEDWAEFDRTMRAERRVAVLLQPGRIYVNP